jgi:hypothetical protein
VAGLAKRLARRIRLLNRGRRRQYQIANSVATMPKIYPFLPAFTIGPLALNERLIAGIARLFGLSDHSLPAKIDERFGRKVFCQC